MKKDTLIYNKCNLCGNSSYDLVWSEGNYKTIKCRKCGLIRLNLEHIREEFKDIYCEGYFKKWYLKYEKERKDYFRKQLEKIKNVVAELVEDPPKFSWRALQKSRVNLTTTKIMNVREIQHYPSRLLDVGCGVGFFLEVAKEQGWDVSGIETSQFASAYVRDRLGLDVSADDLAKADFPDNSFDLITMWDVIAHVTNPGDYLKKAGKLLKQDGLLVIKTPEHPLRLFKLASFISLFTKSKGLLHIPAQIYHFTPEVLSGILRRSGFEVLKAETVKEAIRGDSSAPGLKSFLIFLSTIVLKLLGINESFIIYAKVSKNCHL